MKTTFSKKDFSRVNGKMTCSLTSKPSWGTSLSPLDLKYRSRVKLNGYSHLTLIRGNGIYSSKNLFTVNPVGGYFLAKQLRDLSCLAKEYCALGLCPFGEKPRHIVSVPEVMGY